MIRATFTVAIALVCSMAAATEPPVTILSPCECRGAHGKGRWAVKNDPATPPTDARAVESVTPSDVYSWPGPDVRVTRQSERIGVENKWFALTGRVVVVQVEAESDLHIALEDATNRKPGIVVCEVPAEPRWCESGETVFSWTPTRFPLHIQSTRKLTMSKTPVVTVIGKAFWDIGHTPKDGLVPTATSVFSHAEVRIVFSTRTPKQHQAMR